MFLRHKANVPQDPEVLTYQEDSSIPYQEPAPVAVTTDKTHVRPSTFVYLTLFLHPFHLGYDDRGGYGGSSGGGGGYDRY